MNIEYFFFVQAEDGIRDFHVTGVQTCALPISDPWGNHIGLTKGDGSGPPVSEGDNPPIDWVEIGCAEPEKAWDFYRDLFGWTIEGDMSGEDGAPVHGSFDTGATV